MNVILLEKIRNVGDLGDQVSVAGGYGRNYLIPQGKAVPATKENIAEFEVRRADLEKALAEKLSAAQARKEKLSELSITIAAKTSDEGKLFGSIGTREIEETVSALGIELSKSEIKLPLGPIREIGEHTVVLQLHSDVMAEIVIKVTSEQE